SLSTLESLSLSTLFLKEERTLAVAPRRGPPLLHLQRLFSSRLLVVLSSPACGVVVAVFNPIGRRPPAVVASPAAGRLCLCSVRVHPSREHP
ncbi:hypothetical protein PIB30_082006, partial [Stylosanthes scabra]|nr:hypothetical protein [Stylosanthes scabra]